MAGQVRPMARRAFKAAEITSMGRFPDVAAAHRTVATSAIATVRLRFVDGSFLLFRWHSTAEARVVVWASKGEGAAEAS